MKKIVLALALATLLAFGAQTAMAEDHGDHDSAVHADKDHGKKPAKDLAAVKAAKLKHIDEHIAQLQKARACISAAQDMEAVDACKQKKSGKHHSGKEHGDKEHAWSGHEDGGDHDMHEMHGNGDAR